MHIHAVELSLVKLPLKRPFRTSSSLREAITHVVVRVDAEGATGWGECAAPVDPYYCGETAGTAFLILEQFLAPLVVGRSWNSVPGIAKALAKIKGNPFARAGLELACWDAFARLRDQSLAQLLGGTRLRIESGVSLGIDDDPRTTADLAAARLAEGYRRIKLKIAPGRDLDVVRTVRERLPDAPLQVDANSAYTLEDADILKALDPFALELLEQPLRHDDLLDHATLQKQIQTPLCLDESLTSLHHTRQALDINACRVVNIKPGRVGGLTEALAIHGLCLTRSIPVWCGGMHEFGIGRAGNVALASLPGFTLPGDVSGSDRYYAEDLVEPSILAKEGRIDVPFDRPGLGIDVVPERLDRHTLRRVVVTPG